MIPALWTLMMNFTNVPILPHKRWQNSTLLMPSKASDMTVTITQHRKWQLSNCSHRDKDQPSRKEGNKVLNYLNYFLNERAFLSSGKSVSHLYICWTTTGLCPSVHGENHIRHELGSLVLSRHQENNKIFLQQANSDFGHLNRFGGNSLVCIIISKPLKWPCELTSSYTTDRKNPRVSSTSPEWHGLPNSQKGAGIPKSGGALAKQTSDITGVNTSQDQTLTPNPTLRAHILLVILTQTQMNSTKRLF